MAQRQKKTLGEEIDELKDQIHDLEKERANATDDARKDRLLDAITANKNMIAGLLQVQQQQQQLAAAALSNNNAPPGQQQLQRYPRCQWAVQLPAAPSLSGLRKSIIEIARKHGARGTVNRVSKSEISIDLIFRSVANADKFEEELYMAMDVRRFPRTACIRGLRQFFGDFPVEQALPEYHESDTSLGDKSPGVAPGTKERSRDSGISSTRSVKSDFRSSLEDYGLEQKNVVGIITTVWKGSHLLPQKHAKQFRTVSIHIQGKNFKFTRAHWASHVLNGIRLSPELDAPFDGGFKLDRRDAPFFYFDAERKGTVVDVDLAWHADVDHETKADIRGRLGNCSLTHATEEDALMRCGFLFLRRNWTEMKWGVPVSKPPPDCGFAVSYELEDDEDDEDDDYDED